MSQVWAREPAAVVAVLLAAVNVVAVFVPISDLQRGMLIALVSAVVGLLVRSQVSPVAASSPAPPAG